VSDEYAKRDELKMRGEQPALAEYGANQYGGGDNITSSERGTSAAYLAAKLRRDHPKIADRLARGEFRSVRAAALEAGIIKKLSRFEQIMKWLPE
jgi:hypothetical protein